MASSVLRPESRRRSGACWTKEDIRKVDPRERDLDLDIFRAGLISEPRYGDVLDPEDLAPLCNLRNLRKLKVTGMVDSYQKYIWQIAWLNPRLEELTLEMALEPSIRRIKDAQWPTIKEGWQAKNFHEVETEYQGDEGCGQLHYDIGYGEYLDSLAISIARHDAASKGPVNQKLSIIKLTLSGFIVDAEPWVWFHPFRLSEINFGHDCIDAGFALPCTFAQNVTVSCAAEVSYVVLLAKDIQPGEAKIVPVRECIEEVNRDAFHANNKVEVAAEWGKNLFRSGSQSL